MTQQCPRTCGRCSSSSSSSSNLASSSYSNSASSSGSSSVVYTNCMFSFSTTLFLFILTGVDKVNPSTGVSDCPSRAYLCNDSTYYSLMVCFIVPIKLINIIYRPISVLVHVAVALDNRSRQKYYEVHCRLDKNKYSHRDFKTLI